MHLKALTEKGKKIFKNLTKIKGFYLAGGTASAFQISWKDIEPAEIIFLKTKVTRQQVEKFSEKLVGKFKILFF